MSGAQGAKTCPQCGGIDTCLWEYQTRDGSEWEFCERCGHRRRRIVLRDRKRMGQVRSSVKELLRQGRIDEAVEICGITVRHHEVPQKVVEDFINDTYIPFLKMTKDGYLIYRVYEWRGHGAYSIGLNGTGQLGSLHHNNDIRKKQITSLLSLRNSHEVKVIEVLDDGTIREY